MHYTIENISGIETIFAPMVDANSVTVQIFVKAGSIYETRKNNGISHFLEHMFFKGGKKYPSPMAVAMAVDAFGGTFNAYTSDELASYYVKCAPDFVDKAIDILGDMMVHSTFNTPEIEREKGVIVQEIMMKQDNPARLVFDKWKEFYYGDNSFGWSTLGPVENVQSFSQEDLFAYKEALYTKDNFIVVVAGNLSKKDEIKKSLELAFTGLHAKKTIAKPIFPAILPAQKKAFLKKKTEQNHLILALNGVTGADEKKYIANVISVILGGNMSSRLFQNIREKEGLCYYISGSHYMGEHSGEFFFRAGVEKERFDFAVEKILEEIDTFAQHGPSKEEFETAKGYLVGQLQMGIESSDELAEFLGSQYLIYNKIDDLHTELETYKHMKMDELTPLLGNLRKEKAYLYWIE